MFADYEKMRGTASPAEEAEFKRLSRIVSYAAVEQAWGLVPLYIRRVSSMQDNAPPPPPASQAPASGTTTKGG